ncbi:uncharacterized protein At5g06450 [Durio zibethinus]|uniref:Uncharacterized protein At5g06450 n=1 Tax=Durio zibethinus TaxID=66656 RepID=A0A6P5YUA0_DURZI|nr:uncharacterized protein At5g06450 [Durio zibethinus]
MVVGLDITWSPSYPDYMPTYPDHVLLAFCTQIGCALVRICGGCISHSLKQFFDNKDITYVGVHIKHDVKKLRKRLGLEIRNAVDLSELAADVLHQPRLGAFGVRRLASEVLLVPFKARSSRMAWVNLAEADITTDQIECATIDAYAAYKIGKRLLGV